MYELCESNTPSAGADENVTELVGTTESKSRKTDDKFLKKAKRMLGAQTCKLKKTESGTKLIEFGFKSE